MILNEDGTFGPEMEEYHRKAYQRIVEANNERTLWQRFKDAFRPEPEPDNRLKLQMRPGSELEFYKDGSLKRYKY